MVQFDTCLVSGCYDILHAGHIQFFKDVKSICNTLIVVTASDYSILLHKNRKPAMSENDRVVLLSSIKHIDCVLLSSGSQLGLDFVPELCKIKPNALVVTTDDKYGQQKRELCDNLGIKYVVLPKSASDNSTSSIRRTAKLPNNVPSRVDFAGGWLDVPKYSIHNGYIINCTVHPPISLQNNPYDIGCGMSTSAAFSILNGKDVFANEYSIGCGWQDPASMLETGLCVWKSGETPVLDAKVNPAFLYGKMLIYKVSESRQSGTLANISRNYMEIRDISIQCRKAVLDMNYFDICDAINRTYFCQLSENMVDVSLKVPGLVAKKYLGAGHGGYMLLMFESIKYRDMFANNGIIIEPYLQDVQDKIK